MHRNFEIIIITKLQNNAFLAMQSSRDFCFHFFFFKKNDVIFIYLCRVIMIILMQSKNTN